MPYHIERYLHLLLFIIVNALYYKLGQPATHDASKILAGLYGAGMVLTLIWSIIKKRRPNYGRLYTYMMFAGAYLAIDGMWQKQAETSKVMDMLEQE